MNSHTGEIKDWGALTPEEKKSGLFGLMPRVGQIIRFEGTEFCFRVHRIDPKKVILKPVPKSEYKSDCEL